MIYIHNFKFSSCHIKNFFLSCNQYNKILTRHFIYIFSYQCDITRPGAFTKLNLCMCMQSSEEKQVGTESSSFWAGSLVPRATTRLQRLWGSYTVVSSELADWDYRSFDVSNVTAFPSPQIPALRIRILMNSHLLQTKQQSSYTDPIVLSPRWETNQGHLMWALIVQLKGCRRVRITNASSLNTSGGDSKTPWVTFLYGQEI